MTKQEIVATVYEKLGFSKRESSDIVEHFFTIIKKKLAEGNNVKISGLGNFVVKEKRARKGRNPADRRRDPDCTEKGAEFQAEPGSQGRDKQRQHSDNNGK